MKTTKDITFAMISNLDAFILSVNYLQDLYLPL